MKLKANCTFLVAVIILASIFRVDSRPPNKTDYVGDRGVYPFGSVIPGENFDYSTGAWKQTTCDGGYTVASYLVNRRILGYYGVDFGPSGFNTIKINYSNGEDSVNTFFVEVYLQHPDNKRLLGSFYVTPTGNWCTFVPITISSVSTNAYGVNDLYFMFYTSSSTVGAMNLDYFSLAKIEPDTTMSITETTTAGTSETETAFTSETGTASTTSAIIYSTHYPSSNPSELVTLT
ncbi:hypothetical protein CHUAL_008541 [Chamberlinius hualienensis]